MSGVSVAARVDAGAVTFRWDLDKTYLRTEFESLRKMVRIPFEGGADKVHLPAVPELIQALRRCAERQARTPYVFFLSASPPQIGGAIREKLELDGVEYDGITFKDQLKHLVRGRWGSLREQVGYKLGELLRARIAGPAAACEYLFGDDWESDPVIYSLYADILAGGIDMDTLKRVLLAVEVGRAPVQRILDAAEVLAGSAPDAVGHIYINLERRTPPSRFRPYGPRVVPTFNTLQAGASLFQAGRLDLDAVMDIARALAEGGGYGGHRLRNSIDDLTRRGHLRLETRDRLVRRLARAELAPLAKSEDALRARLREALARFRRRKRLPKLAGADYPALLADWEAD
ncbi:MAG: hypothetical protein P8R42_00025 [Candidatus Binatia bacterium]|nr:hypothetical protein [Candidatus Binatia bacterium]